MNDPRKRLISRDWEHQNPDHRPPCSTRRRFGARKRSLALLGLMAASIGLSGCAGQRRFCTGLREYVHNHFKVGPDYFRPGAPVADEWIDVDDPRVVSQEADYSAWWTTFNDPVLDNLVVTAYQQNLPLRVAALRVVEARAQRGIAVGEIFPQAQEGFAEYSRSEQSVNTFPAFPFNVLNPRRAETWSAGFDASWELDLWGRFRRNIEAADATLDATVEDYDDVLVTLIGDVGATYVEIRSFDERLNLARKNVETQQGSLRIADAQFRNGAVTELDVAQAKLNLANTQRLLPLFEKSRRRAKNRLCVLLGMPPRDIDDLLNGTGPIPMAPSDAAIGIPADLLRRRPDVRAVERQVAAQSARIGVAESDLYPRFIVTGEIAVAASSATKLFEDPSRIGFIGPGFRWNILNYGRIINQVAVQDARYQQLVVQYQNTVLEANREAEDALVDFLRTQEEVERLQESVVAAQRAVDIANTQYRDGAVDFNWVFTLESTLVVQQDELAATQGRVSIALVRLYKALGGGWQIRLGSAGAVAPVQLEPPAENNAPVPPEPLAQNGIPGQ